jgi:hypothetical protein
MCSIGKKQDTKVHSIDKFQEVMNTLSVAACLLLDETYLTLQEGTKERGLRSRKFRTGT